MKNVLLFFVFISVKGFSQSSYNDSIKVFINNYVQHHEVVKGTDKKNLQFYKPNKAYHVMAAFTPAVSSEWINFKTSGTKNKIFKLYGTLSFTLENKHCRLNIYQSQELQLTPDYKDYLFLPFTDLTTGKETYASGRYIDLLSTDIKNRVVAVDFNKAYNPYCAYVSGVYNCPIPPKENALPVAIKTGEKSFKGGH